MSLYRHFTGTCYTVGVKTMADERGAHWLIDAIASHRANPKLKKARKEDQRFHDKELWILRPRPEGGVTLIAVADSRQQKPHVQQDIEYSDFDFKGEPEFKLWCGYTMIPDGRGGSKPGFNIFLPDED